MPRKTQKRRTQKRRTQKRRTQKRQTSKRRLQLGGKFNAQQNKDLRDKLKTFKFLSNKDRKHSMKKLGDISQQFSSPSDFQQLLHQLEYYDINKDQDKEVLRNDFIKWINDISNSFGELVETDSDSDEDD